PGNVLWIIGGEKGIGRMIGEALAQREGVRVVLSSRTGYHHEAVQQDALDVIHCDVTQAEAVRACLATLLER
ncbi:SDR family NAD(P)-dependent oxidoreductase, partial [Klebsiella pneumoniae]|nr:SDR family NAD(P)-dependent oxidoreductase [Klebsiella pneumoniae]